MKALVWHGRRDLRIAEVPEPDEPGAGEAIVEVAFCGICGTDLHEYKEGPVMIRPGPHPLTGQGPPLVLGHEFSGRVAALGPGVEGTIGTRVAVDPCWHCGVCYWCRRGEYHICRLGGAVGLASDGALARFVRVPASGLVPLPDNVDDRVGALVEPLAVGLHAVTRGRLRTGETMLVMGCGPIGAAVLLAGQATGAGAVFVSEPDPDRRALAAAMGATEVFDPATTDVRREILGRTERVGPDVVVECTGLPPLLRTAVDAVRRGGRVVLVGVGHGAAEIEPNRMVLFEREVVGALGYQHDLARVVSLLAAGRFDPGPLITGVVPLSRAVPDGFEALLAKGRHVKILVDIGAS